MRSRLLRFLVALVRYRDVHYSRRLLARATANLRLVTGALGAHYVRIVPWSDFGAAPVPGACERLVTALQPAGFVRLHLAAYHLLLPEVAHRVVVDVGTNEGYGAALFARAARQVVAFDRSAEAIAVAKERHACPNLQFLVHDATRPFPVEDGSVDLVFASEVIEHLEDGPGFLRAAAAALRPGGLLVVKTPNDDYNRLENRLNPHHVSPYTIRRLRAELSRAFENVRIEGLTYREALETAPEDRPYGAAVEDLPYRFGDPIEMDRVMVVRLRVTPTPVPLPGSEVPEYLLARARRRAP